MTSLPSARRHNRSTMFPAVLVVLLLAYYPHGTDSSESCQETDTLGADGSICHSCLFTCHNTGITDLAFLKDMVPNHIYRQLEIVNNSLLTTIQDGDFNTDTVKHITILKLERNNITVIEDNAFVGLDNLKELYLGNNKINNLKTVSLNGLNKLQKLDLKYNSLTHIHADTFKSLPKLKYLYLQDNKMEHLDVEALSGLENLVRLYLFNNRISQLDQSLFANLNALRILSLGNNRISVISENTFQHLNRLEDLTLFGNDITTIENGAFNNLQYLEELNLRINKLTVLERGMFKGLNSLIYLDLGVNNIRTENVTELYQTVFSEMKNLKTVLIAGQFYSIDNGLIFPNQFNYIIPYARTY